MMSRTKELHSCLYAGMVSHQRYKGRQHRLSYRMTNMLIDIDELPVLDQGDGNSRLFGWNRKAFLSFYDRDHGPCDGSPLRPWIEDKLAEAKLDLDGGRVQILCYPRMFGYVFNPLSVWYCYDRDAHLRAVLYEVHNTFSQQHSYLFPIQEDAQKPWKHSCDKGFYVSPFIGMKARYNFVLTPPGDRCGVTIRQTDIDGPLLTAAFVGNKQAFAATNLRRLLWHMPFMTMKVMAAIHWEALKIWLKGNSLQPRPEPPQDAITIIPTPDPNIDNPEIAR